MHRSLNSTEVLSKTQSRIQIGNSRQKMTASVAHSKSPKVRPASSHKPLLATTMISNLQENLIAKNKKLAVMVKSIHSLGVCLEDLDWIINEAESIIKNFIQNMGNKARSPHRFQIENIHNQIVKLIDRFRGMDQRELVQIVPRKGYKMMTQNRNVLNINNPDSIGSFKCTEIEQTENEEDTIPADFSKIKLPSVIKENLSLENIPSSRYEHQMKIKQYEGTIQVLKDELEQQKSSSLQLRTQLEYQIDALNKKIEKDMLEWSSYKNYAGSTIRKCKHHLQLLTHHTNEQEEIERLLDDLFAWEYTIDAGILDDPTKEPFSQMKIRMAEQLAQLEWKLKQNKAELQKVQQYKSRAASRTHTSRSKGQLPGQCSENQETLRMLYVQATTIEHLI